MTTPYPAPALFPNVETVLTGWLASQLQAVYSVTVRTCTETPANLATACPVVQVVKSTGTDLLGILDRPVVDIDCFQPARTDAETLSAQAHDLLLHYLPGSVTGGAVFGLVNTVKSPGWMTYQDLDVRRYNATYEIYLHAAPA